MSDARELRQKAAKYRHIASIRTVGGHSADTQLMALADRIEHEADAQEHRPPAKKKDRPFPRM